MNSLSRDPIPATAISLSLEGHTLPLYPPDPSWTGSTRLDKLTSAMQLLTALHWKVGHWKYFSLHYFWKISTDKVRCAPSFLLISLARATQCLVLELCTLKGKQNLHHNHRYQHNHHILHILHHIHRHGHRHHYHQRDSVSIAGVLYRQGKTVSLVDSPSQGWSISSQWYGFFHDFNCSLNETQLDHLGHYLLHRAEFYQLKSVTCDHFIRQNCSQLNMKMLFLELDYSTDLAVAEHLEQDQQSQSRSLLLGLSQHCEETDISIITLKPKLLKLRPLPCWVLMTLITVDCLLL